MAARTTALAALIACRKTGAWSDGVLKEYIRRDRLDRREAALASRLCYGVVQNRMLLDFYLASFCNGPLKNLQPVVLDILRLGAYQIVMADRIPDSAAVNEAVEQGKQYANHKAAGLINGILRSMVRKKDSLPQPTDLATRYSHPKPLVDLLRQAVGADLLEPLLRCNNDAPGTAVQINPLKANEHEVLSHWDRQEVLYQKHPWLDGCYSLTGAGSLDELPAFQDGTVCVQDPAARLAILGAGLAPGMRVLDCCAAPGGKSFAAAMAMDNRGEIFSCDIHPHKIEIIKKGAARLGIQIMTAQVQNAQELRPDWCETMDAVIADVPCSGLGVIRKKPDIRYKDLVETEALPAVQLRILETVSHYVKPGGVLLYSTCTILPRENEQVAQAFLRSHAEFVPEPMALPTGAGLENAGMLTLLPCVHGTDGFFIAKLRKRP